MIKFTAIDKESQYIQAETSLEYDLKLLLDSGNFVCGKYVKELEDAIVNRLSRFTSKQLYCVGVNSGTTALQLCLEYKKRWFNLPKIIPTTPVTFWATTEAILNAGYTPFFKDICKNGSQIIPEDDSIVVALHGDPIPPGYGGERVIEDNCQCGIEHFNDRYWAACYSLFPSKPLGSCSDGGLVVTTDRNLVDWLTIARYHGIDFAKDRRLANMVASTYRLNEISALFVLKRLECYGWFQEKRKNIVEQYCLGLDGDLRRFNTNHYYHIFNVFVKNRKLLCNILDQHKIQWGMHYNYSAQHQMEFSGYRNILKKDLPNTEWFTEHCLSLPLHPFLIENDVSKTCDVIKPYIINNNV